MAGKNDNPNDESTELAKKLEAAVEAVGGASDADVLFFAATIKDESLSELSEMVAQRSIRRKNLVLLIATLGGDPHCAYRIVKRLWQAYPEGAITMLVHSTCASAGTLMAIGAKEIVMTDTAELGPLDIQLAKPDDLMASMSGLTPTKAVATIREDAFSFFEQVFLSLQKKSRFRITVRTAADISVRLTSGLYEHLFSQVDPFRVAETQRDNQIAMEYGSRLNARFHNLQRNALGRLIHHYPAHEFVIDRQEAADLFENVRGPTASELTLAKLLEPIFADSLGSDKIYVDYLNDEAEAHGEDNAQSPANQGEAVTNGQSEGSGRRNQARRRGPPAKESPEPEASA